MTYPPLGYQEVPGGGLRSVDPANTIPDPDSSEPAELAPQRLFDGLRFADQIGDAGPSVWGQDGQVLWAPGEPFMGYGPQGVGKTTLAQRLLLARVGVGGTLLGFPVQTTDEPTVYVAADRPLQAARSWRRMITGLSDEERKLVRERVKFWKGPLAFDIGAEPEKLLEFVRVHGARTFFGDSLKDLAMDLSKDETGGRVNRALQLLIADGIEVCDLHHPRKAPAGAPHKPNNLSDVYGSGWLTAGHGSVVLLWGNPGDPIVELSHLKQPNEEVGPMRVIIDHERGALSVFEGGDPYAILRDSATPMAARDVARVLFSTDKPTANDVEKARRKLDKLTDKGLAFKEEGGRDQKGHPLPVMYAVTPRQVGLA
jgi:hypothetical protein